MPLTTEITTILPELSDAAENEVQLELGSSAEVPEPDEPLESKEVEFSEEYKDYEEDFTKSTSSKQAF